MAKRIKQRVNVNGIDKWVTGYTMQDILVAAAALINQANQASTVNVTTTQKTLFKPYAENWKRLYKDASKKHTTLSEYASLLKKHLIPAFGDRFIEEITTDDIQMFMNGKAEYSRKSIHEMQMLLGMILESALEDGIITRNPARSKRLSNPSTRKTVREPLTRDEALDVINRIHELTEERDRQYVALLVYTGMRRNEVLGLKWQDIDFTNGVIHVRRGVTFKANHPVISTPKTAAGVRDIPLHPQLREWLIAGNPNVFVIGGGEDPITQTTCKRMWERIKRTINVYEKTPHYFRHTFMTFANRAGIPEKTLQTIGGYADVQTLRQIYTHTQQEDVEAASSIIQGMFSPAM